MSCLGQIGGKTGERVVTDGSLTVFGLTGGNTEMEWKGNEKERKMK